MKAKHLKTFFLLTFQAKFYDANGIISDSANHDTTGQSDAAVGNGIHPQEHFGPLKSCADRVYLVPVRDDSSPTTQRGTGFRLDLENFRKTGGCSSNAVRW